MVELDKSNNEILYKMIDNNIDYQVAKMIKEFENKPKNLGRLPPTIEEVYVAKRLGVAWADNYIQEKSYRPIIPEDIRSEVLERDNHQCTECTSTENLHLHHIIYASKGGEDIVENLITLCIRCHMEKHQGEAAYYLLRGQAERSEV